MAQFNTCFARLHIDSSRNVNIETEFDPKDILKNSLSQLQSPDVAQLSKEHQELILKFLRRPEHREKIRTANLAIVKELISRSVSEDTFIIQSINSIEDLDRICNTLAKRIREWYAYYFPELEHLIEDNEVFVKRILQKPKSEFMKDYSISVSMGPELSEKDIDVIIGFAREINDLYIRRDSITKYLEDVMKSYCPNIYELTGALIGAKLIEKAGSLRQLVMMPSSTVQLLGAEKALFRHLRNKKSRPPKHGYILSHPYVMNARREDKGTMARSLAGKISIAAKVDYFKGESIAGKLKEELDAQAEKINKNIKKAE